MTNRQLLLSAPKYYIMKKRGGPSDNVVITNGPSLLPFYFHYNYASCMSMLIALLITTQ